MTQRTSVEVKPVSTGLAVQLVRMDEDFVRQYPGGLARLELAKGHPDIKARTFALWDELARERELALPLTERGPWANVQLGTYPNVVVLEKEIDTRNGLDMGSWARDILKKVSVASQPTNLDLYIVGVGELGFTKNTRRDVIYAAAEKLGFYPVPAEVGPQVALQFGDKFAIGEWAVVASEPILDSDRSPSVFYVRRSGDGFWLAASYGRADFGWNPVDRFLFCRK